MIYYYKTERALLKAKHELTKEELGDWVAITKEEYLSLKASIFNLKNRKSKKNQEENVNV